jgi:cob(I)alamin adenosyltransferase
MNTDHDEQHRQNEQHRRKMIRRKQLHEKKLAAATVEKGLLIVHTGAGKGKTTAALGMVFRALGHGQRVGVVQFTKGAITTGEALLAERLAPQLVWHTLGKGYTWDTQDRQADIAVAREAWAKACELLRDPTFNLVVLDELNIVLRYDYLPLPDVLAELTGRRPELHVVVTGRNAKAQLIEAADLVTEMTLIKHPFRSGVKPQPGIEY